MKHQWLIGFAALFALVAQAGQETHGGDAVDCSNKEVVVLDYYHAALPGFGETQAPIPDISGWTKQQAFAFLLNRLKGYLVAQDVADAAQRLGDVDKWISADLKDVNDGNEPYLLPETCQRRQLASRQGDQMFIDPAVAKKLAPAQLGILEFHEAVYYVAAQHHATTSEAVRALIRVLLRKDSTTEMDVHAIQALGAHAYLFELLFGNNFTTDYFPETGSEHSLAFPTMDAVHRTLSARRRTPSGIYDGGADARIACDANGSTCTVTDQGGVADREFLPKGATFEILDGGRRLHFHNGINDYYYSQIRTK